MPYAKTRAGREKRRVQQQMRRDKLGMNGRRAHRSWHLFRTYGITADEWDIRFSAQGFRCAACGTLEAGRTFNRKSPAWHTDHNPAYPKGHPKFIRGILCHWCNIALHKRQTPSTLRALADYLEKHQ
jgi:hypothetical protein